LGVMKNSSREIIMHQEVRKMKKVLILSVILLSVLATAGWLRPIGVSGSGSVHRSTVVVAPLTPLPILQPAYDHYGYEYPGYGYRRWVPATGSGDGRLRWKRVWIPGYRQYLR